VLEDTVSQLRSCSNARRGTAKSSERSRRSTGMQRRVGPPAVRRRRRRQASGQWESAQPKAGTDVAPVTEVLHRPMRTSLSTLQGSRAGSRACAAPIPGGRSCGVLLLARGSAHRAPRAFSSVGESARLITVRSLVRIQKGPRPPHRDGPLQRSAWGRSSAGRAPALQAGGRRFEPGRLHSLITHRRPRDGTEHIDNSNRSLRSGM
jgi:hypothetical protein